MFSGWLTSGVCVCVHSFIYLPNLLVHELRVMCVCVRVLEDHKNACRFKSSVTAQQNYASFVKNLSVSLQEAALSKLNLKKS